MRNIETFSFSPSDLSRLPKRPADSSKRSFGRTLCVCGSVGMSGAAYLCAKASLRMGAGLARVITPSENLPIIQTLIPEAVVSPYSSSSPDIPAISSLLENEAEAIVCGCGLGTSPVSLELLRATLRASSAPTLLDADALNLISRHHTLKKYLKNKIITPHLWEFSRLTGLSPEQISASPEEHCRAFAKEYGAVCVLKGHRTCVSDGSDSVYINLSGNSGMATAGSGDVLAGIIGGILAQSHQNSLSLLESACLGIYIHGLAGDAAAEDIGEYSLIASDIIEHLPSVTKKIHSIAKQE